MGEVANARGSRTALSADKPSTSGLATTTNKWGVDKIRQHWNYFVNNITVEPMLACYIMPSVLASLATQNLNLEKACYVNLGYDRRVCEALTARETANYTEQETSVQQLVAGMTVWKTIVQSAIPSVMMLFLGSWSDRNGRRKPLMLLPIIGEFLTSMGLIVCTYFFYELPMEIAGLCEALFPAITGGWFTMFMAVFSYIGDVTSVDMRTLRIGVVNVFVSLGVPVGMALSGVLYVQIGFYGIFLISATLYVISFFYGMTRIKEEKKIQPIEKLKGKKTCGKVRDFFDVQHVMETFKVVFKEGKGNRKMRVIMLMVCCMVIIGPMHGEMAVMYLFTRYRFNWNEVDFSIFSTYSMITNLLGTMVSVGVFSHMLKIDDALIGVMSCMSKILSCFVYAFATTTWMIYLAPIVEILNGTSFIAMRSIISKLVPPDELGKVNSLFGVCEALMPLVYGPMYSAVYTSTIHTLPGAFFLLGGALTLPAVLMFLWMYMVHKQELKRQNEEQTVDAGDGEKTGDAAVTNTFVPPSITEGGDLKKTAVAPASPGVVNKAYDPDSDESERPPPDFADAVPTAPAANGQVNKSSFELCDEKL